MADLLALSARIIDSGVADEPVNRTTQELSEVGDGVAMVESFSHVVTFRTDEGLVCFDASGAAAGGRVVESLRRWTSDPIHSLVYTHGHVDHVGGSGAFVADARESGRPDPVVVGHANVPVRMDRYDRTNGYNTTINARQFGGVRGLGIGIGGEQRFLPADAARPDVTFTDRFTAQVGDVTFQMRHAKGETDDHLWAWVPQHKALCTGDFLIWNFPNAGNPQKVQRYPLEWAHALREMAAMDAELLLPAHGLPIAGRDRIAGVLGDVATALEHLVADTLALMNEGATLDHILHTVRVDPDLLAKPYLRPLYDEPEFVVRNVWRLYGGWYDGNPAHLKPAPQSAFAAELASLAGGSTALAARAREVADGGDLRLACQLVELAVQAAPDDVGAHRTRAEIYEQRRQAESSLMAKGIYGWAVRQSTAAADGEGST
ncbi:alkyl sulfatase dimerization domain-containing protein [Actinomarinicola tropica]|uniref:MBL fold metallo-hydrolase n=1 Tax=Actinomarinicola tropica TaxID=2789776 RepID=A0A5Q2RDJ7_9ACTN|nr:alkyl sulfatase dimerization domain-containing protein [Actinomarinicola tropica]QGG93774.1 MBL fold metallo-hydrolase [Actinomarinicola tropica]